jgi:hypothetical protein
MTVQLRWNSALLTVEHDLGGYEMILLRDLEPKVLNDTIVPFQLISTPRECDDIVTANPRTC